MGVGIPPLRTPPLSPSPSLSSSQILEGKIKFPWHFDRHSKDLIKKLLTADLTKRLGNLKGGADDIKRHKWCASPTRLSDTAAGVARAPHSSSSSSSASPPAPPPLTPGTRTSRGRRPSRRSSSRRSSRRRPATTTPPSSIHPDSAEGSTQKIDDRDQKLFEDF